MGDHTPSVQAVASWWDRHSQDYLEDKGTYGGFDLSISDEEFQRWIRLNDDWFRHQAYFGQNNGANTELFDALISYNELNGRTVLEVGCGLGSHTHAFARQGACIIAVDVSTTATRATKRRLELNGLTGDVIQASAEHLPFQPRCVDFIWSWGVIHHSPDTHRAATEIMRVLKSEGRFSVMIYYLWSWWAVVGILLRYGMLHGGFWKHSAREVLRSYSDGKNVGGAPIARYYSKNKAKRLFAGASQIVIRNFGTKAQILNLLPKLGLPKDILARLLPDWFYNRFFAWFGHMMLVEGKVCDSVRK